MAESKAKIVKTKKRCCKDLPRCKKCPVVLRRLEAAALAERMDKRIYAVSPKVTKKQVKRARKRPIAA